MLWVYYGYDMDYTANYKVEVGGLRGILGGYFSFVFGLLSFADGGTARAVLDFWMHCMHELSMSVGGTT